MGFNRSILAGLTGNGTLNRLGEALHGVLGLILGPRIYKKSEKMLNKAPGPPSIDSLAPATCG